MYRCLDLDAGVTRCYVCGEPIRCGGECVTRGYFSRSPLVKPKRHIRCEGKTG